MGEMNHDDNISIKLGGIHMGRQWWYDNGVSVYKGQTASALNPNIHKRKDVSLKAQEIGDVRNKRVGICNRLFQKGI